MANIAGYKGTVTWDSDVIGTVTSVDVNLEMESLDATANGNAFKSFLPGQYQGSVSAEMHFDDGDTAQSAMEDDMLAGTSATLLVKLDGSTSHFSGSAFITGLSYSGSQGSTTKCTVDFQYTGALTLSI